MPSTQLVVSTFSAVWSQLTAGMTKSGVVLDVLGHLRDRGRLEPEVELEPRRAVERLDHIGRPQPPQSPASSARPARAPGIIALEIGAEALLDPGPQDLDRHGFADAVARRRAPCAPARSRPPRSAARCRCSSAALLVQRVREQLRHQRRIERRHRVLQLRQIGGDLGADDVGPGRQRLPELHIGRPQPVERPASAARAGPCA